MIDIAGSARYDAAYAALMEDVRTVPAGRREEPGVCGVWSLKDLLGHLAYWDQQQAAELRAIASGQPFIPEAADDENAINAREATKRASNSWAEIVTEVEQTNAGLRPLLNDPGETNARYLIHDHWEEHGAQIRAWKEANGV